MMLSRTADHLILVVGCFFMLTPLALLFWASLRLSPEVMQTEGLGAYMAQGFSVYRDLLFTEQGFAIGPPPLQMLFNSFVIAAGVALVITCFALLAAYALVFFRLPCADLIFGAILLSLFFPLETRILPSFLVTDQLGLLNSYGGLVLPVAATGLGVLVFRQFLRQFPGELFEAARIDGAGPMRIFLDFILPLSVPMMGALFLFTFVIGWNQYLWPLMISTSGEDLMPIMRAVERAGRAGQAGMALSVLAILPPLALMILAQRWILRGLTAALQ